MPRLNEWRYELFCRELVRDPLMNQGKAAFRAGFAADSGRKDTAPSRASKLMDREDIKARVDELLEQRMDRLRLDADDLLDIVDRCAAADIRDYYREVWHRTVLMRDGEQLPEGSVREPGDVAIRLQLGENDARLDSDIRSIELIPPTELTVAQAMAITGTKLDRSGRMVYTFAKESMLALLMRHLGLLNDKVDVTTNGQSLNISDEERAARIAAILERGRQAGTGRAPSE